MKKLFAVFVLIVFISAVGFCQDYIVDYSLNNGYTLVYKVPPATSGYQVAPEKIYGVINDAKKIVVPLQYKSIRNSGEPGVFEIEDVPNNAGLYSAVLQKVLIAPQYYEIENFREGLAVVKKRKADYGFTWGAVDVRGQVIIPVEYDYLGTSSEGLMNFKQDNKMGFIDKTNKIIIPAMYDDFSAFSEGLAAVKTIPGGKYGYIDKNNNMVIAAQYEDADPFYSGYAVVARKKSSTSGSAGKGTVTVPGEYILITKTGKEIAPMTFNRISPHQAGGLFIIELDKKKGVMDSTGMPILPVEFADVTVDRSGYIIYKTADKKFGMMSSRGSEILSPKYDYVSQTTAARYYSILNGKYEVGDVNRNIFIKADSANGVILGKKRIIYFYDHKIRSFDLNGNLQKTIPDLNLKRYGHSLTETEDSIILNTDAAAQLVNLSSGTRKTLPFGEAGDFNEEGVFVGKNANSTYDFYDYNGRKLNTESYYAVVNFSEGVCALQVSSTSVPHLADRSFKKIKDLYTYYKGPYSEGLAYATNSQTGMIYYLDKNGREAFNMSAKEGGKCIEGFIGIKDNNNRFYHVNRMGKPISTKTWDEVADFSEGLALVKEKGKWGFIDTTGNKAIDIKYDLASNFSKGAAIVKLNNKFFLINKKGQAIGSTQYDAAGNPGNGTFPVQKDNQVGLIDSKGNVIVDFKYESILYMSEDRVWAAKNGKWGLLDNKGKPLTEFIYQGAYDFEDGFSRVVFNDKIGVVNKSGKLVLPAQYKSLSKIYKGIVISIEPADTEVYPLK